MRRVRSKQRSCGPHCLGRWRSFTVSSPPALLRKHFALVNRVTPLSAYARDSVSQLAFIRTSPRE